MYESAVIVGSFVKKLGKDTGIRFSPRKCAKSHRKPFFQGANCSLENWAKKQTNSFCFVIVAVTLRIRSG